VNYKLETYMKIARLYLEDDDPVQAESFINRASHLQVSLNYTYLTQFLLVFHHDYISG